MKKKLLLFAAALFCCIFTANAQVQCQANIMALPVNGTTVVNFYDSSYTSSGQITSWLWYFGDGGISNLPNPTHTYANGGVYTVCLVIQTSTGCSDSTCIALTISSGCSITSVMSFDTTTQVLTITPTSGTAPYTYQWNTGSNQSVITTTGPGSYCCTVTDANGCTDNNCYTVQGGGGSCQAYFLSNQVQTNVWQFTDTSFTNGGTVTYLWNFGDGGTSTQQNPVHTFANNGTYTVCLTITTPNCSDQYCSVITVGGGCNLYVYAYLDTFMTSIQTYVTGGPAPFTYLWSNGSTASSISPGAAGTYCVTVTDANLCTATSCYTYGGAPTDTLCGTVFNDINGNGVLDGNEVGTPGAYIYIYGSGIQMSATTNASGNYNVAVPPGTYQIWYCTNGFNATFTVPSNDTAGCAIYDSVVVSGSGTFCGYNFGYQINSVVIEGTVFIDTNNNGVMDAGEIGVPYQYVNVNGYYGYTDANGNYSVIAGTGNNTITYTPSGFYSGFTLSTPGSITLTGTLAGTTYSGNNFGIYMPPGSTNLSVNITPHTTVTPGFGAWYDIQVCNIGSNISGGTLMMIHDPNLTFDYSSPVQASYNAGTQTLTWNVAPLAPGQCTSYWVDFTASASLSIGASTLEFVNLSVSNGPDVDLSNNSDTVHQIVTSSWDPNNKLSVATNFNDPNYQVISSVNPNQTIDYSINFQNMGTSAAVNISVIDIMSPDLDANSFQLLGTSHLANVSRNGSNLTFLFPNIMLPDATSNPGASHGYVNFRVNSLNGLAAGHVISDDAAIYFDFNSPVITNPALVTMINPTGLADNTGSLNNVTVYPNPVKDRATVAYHLDRTSNVRITLSDIQGKQVAVYADQKLDAGDYKMSIVTDNISGGMYLLTIQADDFVSTVKVNVLK